MNYFELHIGDYEAATAHLTMLEDAAYCRMLRIYYRTEKPLPADKKQVYRLTRAQSKQERDAVDQVLADFFSLGDDGWHQTRCDEEVARFVAGEPEREVKKANEDNRMKRHRDERAALFKALTDAGQHAPWNIGMQDLRALVKALQTKPETAPETEPETPAPPLPATAPATPATATQTPDTRHQSPIEEIRHTDVPPTDGGRVCRLMRNEGLAEVNPAHPDLLALIEAGASDEEFRQAALATVERGKGFAYALGIVKGQRKQAAEMANGLHRGPMPQAPPSRKERQLTTAALMTGATPKATPKAFHDDIDIDARIIENTPPRLGQAPVV